MGGGKPYAVFSKKDNNGSFSQHWKRFHLVLCDNSAQPELTKVLEKEWLLSRTLKKQTFTMLATLRAK